MFCVPLGLRLMMEVFRVSPGTVHSCKHILEEGHILAIAPGTIYIFYYKHTER